MGGKMAKREESDGVWQWLVDQGEEAVQQVAGDILRNSALTDALGQAIRKAAETKGEIDRNLERLLSSLGVVTRADHERLVRSVETLQGSLVNINIKLDRLLAQIKEAEKPARRPAKKKSDA